MSAHDPADIWAWIHQDKDRLEKEGGQKSAIVAGWNDFWRAYHENFEAAEVAISGAIEAAKAQGELRWELLLRHWRLQLWTRDDIARALPEAVDLLSLATDERVRDVPQRICAFHDLVECHTRMDAAGYYEDIVANSQDVLAQLPKRHQCADCARLNAARAAVEAGRTEEAQSWLTQLTANLAAGTDSAWGPSHFAEIHAGLGEWEDAEREYGKTVEKARKLRRNDEYFDGLLGIARARAAKGSTDGAVAALREARHMAKYTGDRFDLARLMEVEGVVAVACQQAPAAIEYFTRAARQYLDLSRYRLAALTGLRAAELAREAEQPEPDKALDIAARAAGMMPPASADVVRRLRAFGREPLVPETATHDVGMAGGTDEPVGQSERAALEDALASHVANGNARGVAVALYRLGRWHAAHGEPRAAVDYFIANAILERALKLTIDDREDALYALGRLQERLPPGTVQAALAAAESGPTGALARLLSEVPSARWRWLVRGVAAEAAGKPVVEPEPRAEEGRGGFDEWLKYVAEMIALVLRFYERSDPAMRERWAAMLDETAEDMGKQVPDDQGGRELLSLVRGLAELTRGTPAEQVVPSVLPPFNQIVAQIVEAAKEPVWRHPGMAPLDFLVEKVAQQAVRALRLRDEHRRTRLENLAWRFELMNMDLRQPEQLREVSRFVEGLRALLSSDGERMPDIEPPLKEPFAPMLAAVYEAGKSSSADASRGA